MAQETQVFQRMLPLLAHIEFQLGRKLAVMSVILVKSKVPLFNRVQQTLINQDLVTLKLHQPREITTLSTEHTITCPTTPLISINKILARLKIIIKEIPSLDSISSTPTLTTLGLLSP